MIQRGITCARGKKAHMRTNLRPYLVTPPKVYLLSHRMFGHINTELNID